MGVKFTGFGSHFPEKTFSDGAFRRHQASPDEGSVFLGTQAARRALQNAGMKAEEVDLALCFSGMPDYEYPKDINLIAENLGMRNACCQSVDTACASFITALGLAHAQISSGRFRNALILCVMNWTSRGIDASQDSRSVGDGASAALLRADAEDSLLGIRETTATGHFDFLTLKSPFATGGREFFHFGEDPRHGRFLAREALRPALDLIEKHGSPDWLVAHQTNEKLLRLWAKALKTESLHTFPEYGNMSAVNIPATLDEFVNRRGKIKKGDKILLFAPGAGLHLAAALCRL